MSEKEKEKSDVKDLYHSRYHDLLIKIFQVPFGEQAEILLDNLVEEKKYDDKKIYALLHELYRQKNIKYEPEPEAKKRAKKTTENVRYFLGNYQLKIPIGHYLDIGCEDCYLPISLGKLLDAKDVSCINIEDWESDYALDKTALKKQCDFKFYDGVNIPYPDNSISFVSILMVLHHATRLRALLKNISRVLVNDGYLLVKEHDSPEPLFDKLIDVQHYIYDAIYFGKYIENYKTKYYSLSQMTKTIETMGNFKLIKVKMLGNYTRSYFALYQIKK